MLACKEEPWLDGLLPPEVICVLRTLQQQAQPVILENRGEGVIGTDVVADAPTSGYLAGAHARARTRLWTRYADEVATEAVKLPSFVKNIQPELRRMPREEMLAAIERIPDAHIRARWRKAATGSISADDLKPSIARLTGMVERMDRALQDAPWLAGDEVSLADIDIAPFVQRLVRLDLFGLVAARPPVNDWYGPTKSTL